MTFIPATSVNVLMIGCGQLRGRHMKNKKSAAMQTCKQTGLYLFYARDEWHGYPLMFSSYWSLDKIELWSLQMNRFIQYKAWECFCLINFAWLVAYFGLLTYLVFTILVYIFPLLRSIVWFPPWSISNEKSNRVKWFSISFFFSAKVLIV